MTATAAYKQPSELRTGRRRRKDRRWIDRLLALAGFGGQRRRSPWPTTLGFA